MATIRVTSRHVAGVGRPDAISAEPAFKRQQARKDAIAGMLPMPLPAERRDPSATRSEHTGFLWHPRHESGFVRSKDEKTTQPCEIKSTANAPVARLQAFRVVMRQIGQMAHFYTNRCHTPIYAHHSRVGKHWGTPQCGHAGAQLSPCPLTACRPASPRLPPQVQPGPPSPARSPPALRGCPP